MTCQIGELFSHCCAVCNDILIHLVFHLTAMQFWVEALPRKCCKSVCTWMIFCYLPWVLDFHKGKLNQDF